VQCRVVPGPAGRGLVETAQSVNARLVILSARGDGAVARLIGTVSQYVLRNAPCPVLVVPTSVRDSAPQIT
jgi:nucleotide-binding universal stress UspA family protein